MKRIRLWLHCLTHFHRSYAILHIRSDGSRYWQRGCNDCAARDAERLIDKSPLSESDIEWANKLVAEHPEWAKGK